MFKGFFGNKEKDKGGEFTPTPRSPVVELITILMIWIGGGVLALWLMFAMMPMIVMAIEVIQR
jgi:hypothetical protein